MSNATSLPLSAAQTPGAQQAQQPQQSARIPRFTRAPSLHTLREPVTKLTKRTLKQTIAYIALIIFAAAMFFINLTASGYANEFYSAAAQAGASNWEAFLWGSSDMGNSITVDKPPAALWLMALSVRVFGLSSFAILLPQALLGVASVALLYAAVSRYWGRAAGLLAGFSLATTPVVVLMFRFNNPDALLVFLEIATIYALVRALEYAANRQDNAKRTGWMVLAGVCVGFGFLTKQMQVFLILPGCALAFLLASPTGWGRRILDSLAALASVVVSAGWWVLLTVLVPASSRPYIGGSQNNSFLELTFGYNGLGRLTGNENGSVVPGGGAGSSGGRAAGSAFAEGMTGMAGGSAGGPGVGGMGARSGGMWGETGITRLFTGTFASQITWLSLLAFAGIVLGLVAARHTLRTDLRRASTLAWGSWLVVTWLVFSFMAGIFHQYYTVALAPALAALVAIGLTVLWQHREHFWARLVAALLVAVNTAWAVYLLSGSTWNSWLAGLVGITGALATLTLPVLALFAYPSQRLSGWRSPARAFLRRVLTVVALASSALALYTGPMAWSAYTVSTGHHGSIVVAGPESAMGGGPGGHGGPSGSNGQAFPGMPGNQSGQQGQLNQQGQQGQGTGQGTQGSQNGPMAGPNGSSGQQGSQSQNGQMGSGMNGQSSDGNSSNGQSGSGQAGDCQSDGSQPGNGQRQGGQRGGNLLGGGQVSSKVIALLKQNASKYTWVAATTGSQSAAGYQLNSGYSVMPIGGFNGSDPAPTLAQFKKLVKQGKIHYYISGGGMGGQQNGGSQAASQISQWVAQNFTAKTVDGVTLYDLSEK